MVVVANDVLIEKCLFRIAAGNSNRLSPTASRFVFFGAQPVWMKDYVLKKTSSLVQPVRSEVTGVGTDGVNNSVTVAAWAGSQFFAVLKR